MAVEATEGRKQSYEHHYKRHNNILLDPDIASYKLSILATYRIAGYLHGKLFS